MKKRYSFSTLLIVVLLTTVSCTLATVRSLSEDAEAKVGFNPDLYVESIWESQFVPTVRENAIEINTLLGEIRTNQNAAIQAYGNRNGTGAYSFLTFGEAQVLAVDLESRIGFLSVDFHPFDGNPDANIAIGPVIRRRDNAAIDAVGFIRFNDFVNQTEFASVSDAVKSRILRDVIEPLDIENMTGEVINFYGAFTLENIDDLEIIPVILEVQ
jgi:predicted lipoprotein